MMELNYLETISKNYITNFAKKKKSNIWRSSITIVYKQILDEINRINELDVDDDILISPTDNKNVYREDVGINEDVDVLRNAPKKSGNYIEIKRFVND